MQKFRKYVCEPAFFCVQLASFLHLIRKMGDERYANIRPADAILSLIVYDIWFWGSTFILAAAALSGHLTLIFLSFTLFSFVPTSLALRLLLDWGAVKKRENRK